MDGLGLGILDLDPGLPISGSLALISIRACLYRLQTSPSGLAGYCAGCGDSSTKTLAQASSAVWPGVIVEVGVVKVAPLPPVEVVLDNPVLKVLILFLLSVVTNSII